MGSRYCEVEKLRHEAGGMKLVQSVRVMSLPFSSQFLDD